MKPALFITRTLPKPAMDILHNYFKVTMNAEERVLEKKEIIANIKDQDALLCLLTDTIDLDVLNAAPKLKAIANYAAGFNNIDIQEATRRKIPVCITPGILTEATADLTWGLILDIARRIPESDQFVRKGLFKGWAPKLFLGSDVYGKTLGIIGMGKIGQAVAKRAFGFNMHVLYTAHAEKNIPNAHWVSLDELLKTADIISIHTPLTKETHHLIGTTQLKQMKKEAYLINTSRGSVIDELALLAALKNKTIQGAGLDVYKYEPALTPGLTELDNVVLLPHTGSATMETRAKMALLTANNLIAIFKGQKPSEIVNPTVFDLTE